MHTSYISLTVHLEIFGRKVLYKWITVSISLRTNWIELTDTHWIQLWNNVISSVIRKKSDVTKISKVMWRKRKQTWIFFPKDAKVSMSGNKVRNPIMKPHARPHVVRPLVEAWWGFQNPVCCWVFFFPTRIGKIMRYVPFLAPN